MTDLNIPITHAAGTKAKAADVNENNEAIEDFINDTGVPKVQAGGVAANSVGTDELENDSVTPAKLNIQGAIVAASGSIVLPAQPTVTEMPGATFTCSQTGIYLVFGVFCFQSLDGGGGAPITDAVGRLLHNGSPVVRSALLNFAGEEGLATVAQNWVVNASAGDTLKLGVQASAVYVGTWNCLANDTTLMAVVVGA